jgi:catechol 2,3-dioxygenase-like lactoylglutathione lyase family enzyme
MAFRAQQIDHVEVWVSDRQAAAEWYLRVLGLTVVEEYRHWSADPRGPLMISSDGGSTKIALFQRREPLTSGTGGWRLTAFRADAAGFASFVRSLDALSLSDGGGRPVESRSVVDHDQALSVYFCDPDGNALELTTYEVAPARRLLETPAPA